ncbi:MULTISPECIES: copper chaperone PCu(A)C [unclassified Thioalkalivibrio]|uniref:copper chaperone PCu(A)C n=1 Tax=unclassified Thioalkalivibrio TaxID=2621013 RepID=UPI000195A367|nr:MULTISPECIES: copper chaperone PCu(A)C [unclassified Thioalkalivibrio]ADC72222.1 protein of unknown function DUF461 [Thioalkalivibrio sp. K90mix]
MMKLGVLRNLGAVALVLGLGVGGGTTMAEEAPEACECLEGLEMEGTPWVRLVPGDTTAGYLELRNTGGSDRRIVAAESPIAETTELHEHTHEDGVMRMREVEHLDLPAGEALVLEPGGLHLMFIGLHEPLTAGDWVAVRVTFEDGETMDLHMQVRRGEAEEGAGHDHMEHDDAGHGHGGHGH